MDSIGKIIADEDCAKKENVSNCNMCKYNKICTLYIELLACLITKQHTRSEENDEKLNAIADSIVEDNFYNVIITRSVE